ncbi:MAG: 3-hydroxyacyl-CoA dehydrogenase NAD-binding domain-containing protein [bacterium]
MEIGQIGIAGSGTMGSGIAQTAARNGLDVHLYDISDEIVQGGVEAIRGRWDRMVEEGEMSGEEREAAEGRIRTTTSLEAMGEVDAVIDAAPEDLGLKKRLFRDLDLLTPQHALLAAHPAGAQTDSMDATHDSVTSNVTSRCRNADMVLSARRGTPVVDGMIGPGGDVHLGSHRGRFQQPAGRQRTAGGHQRGQAGPGWGATWSSTSRSIPISSISSMNIGEGFDYGTFDLIDEVGILRLSGQYQFTPRAVRAAQPPGPP